jgi:hypothetical protein
MTYTPFPGTSITEAIENAIRMSRATGKDIVINLNDVHFSVNRETNVQDAINTYLDALNKRYNEKKQLQQHTR